MYQIIFSYFTAIILTVFFQTDLYSGIFLIFLCFTAICLCNFYKGHFKFIKDIGFWGLTVVCILTFSAGSMYTQKELDIVSYRDFSKNFYQIEGQIVDMKPSGNQQVLTLNVESLEDLSDKNKKTPILKYINIPVSPVNQFTLYDRISLVGNIAFKNYQIYKESEPLFFDYEFEKFLYNTPYNVSQVKNISKIEREKSLREKVLVWFQNFSETLKSKVNLHMQEPYAAIALGISMGEQENLTKELKDMFKTSGLIHILVLSGANISFIISLVWFTFQRFKLRKNFTVVLSIIFSWMFILMTGLNPPSVRAGVMLNTNIIAEFFAKNISSVYSLLFALFILTLISPLSLIYSPSLHLSFLACFGIFTLAPKMEVFLRKKFLFGKVFSMTLSNLVAIFLTVTPYVLALTGSASLFGSLLTLVVEPFVMLTTMLSFLIIIFSFVNFYLAEFFGILNSISTNIILLITKFGAENFPQIFIQIPKTFLIIYYLLLLLLTHGIMHPKESNGKESNKI